MKTLLLYASKTGSTRHCAELIGDNMENIDFDVLSVKEIRKVDLSNYEQLIIGSSLYMGRINKKLKKYLQAKKEELLEKKLHFFVCGLAQGQEGVELFQKEIPTELFANAVQVRQLGSEIHLDKLNFLYRAIMKKIIETENPAIGLLEADIKEFAKVAST
ncbi:MAG: flavodoxin domain-containing protein [Bacilli bacterium]|nr:flavodoxin domain-containing protein [Bacilli bacterium]MBN2696314.1 flavodoxin domain-containing protein [Bacilli bacterium]